ncbi:hypothetical protein DB347_00310 [Opitutaceae bacterium EW11]|nr:hypothetical protein DB347_00310 [Opitutaceae bacterium EW11]
MNTHNHTPAAADEQAVFDVRPIPCRVKHRQIFQRWFGLPVGGYFVLLNDHDPLPLRYQFEAEFGNAFGWDYIERGPEDFRVKITKFAAVEVPAGFGNPTATKSAPSACGETLDVDARGLEPPEPLIRILDALESLPSEKKLRAWTDREPCHLFGEAKTRGFSAESRAQADGSWVTVLSRV